MIGISVLFHKKKCSFIKIIGIAYDFPDSNGYGGNTTTSEACRKFYRSSELRARLVDLCPALYRNAFQQILFNDLIILRLISCRYRVLVDKIGIMMIIEGFIYLFSIIRQAMYEATVAVCAGYWSLDSFS